MGPTGCGSGGEGDLPFEEVGGLLRHILGFPIGKLIKFGVPAK